MVIKLHYNLKKKIKVIIGYGYQITNRLRLLTYLLVMVIIHESLSNCSYVFFKEKQQTMKQFFQRNTDFSFLLQPFYLLLQVSNA